MLAYNFVFKSWVVMRTVVSRSISFFKNSRRRVIESIEPRADLQGMHGLNSGAYDSGIGIGCQLISFFTSHQWSLYTRDIWRIGVPLTSLVEDKNWIFCTWLASKNECLFIKSLLVCLFVCCFFFCFVLFPFLFHVGENYDIPRAQQKVKISETAKIWLVGWLVGFLTSSSTSRLYVRRVPRLKSEIFTCCYTWDRAGRPWLLSQSVTLYWHRTNRLGAGGHSGD